MKKFFKEDFGKPYPDSLSEVFGKGKPITQADFDVILSWLPAERREYYSNSEGKKELVEWLLKWKLFSAHAEKSGFTKQPEIKKALDWAWKVEVATEYVNKVLLPKAQVSKSLDTTMVKYALTDDAGAANLNPDTSDLNRRLESLNVQNSTLAIDSIIFGLRNKVGVTFFQNDWRDEKSQNPVKLIATADSLRDSAKTDEAERIYNTLSNEYSFSPEGKRALIEAAKILTEKQSYYQAIANYRRYLINGDDKSKFCNVFFMIGFIYDEYLDKPELAEINYKYVLKNLPGCELTDDAEFMMLHLGEPMSSIEELQSEALRQGRKVEPSDTAAAK
jgi:tetratricopeptide (TPR) repeat protein